MSEKLEAYFGLPSEVKFCKKCVISNQRPSSTIEFKHDKTEKKKVIEFDEEGVCSACRYHEEEKEKRRFYNRTNNLNYSSLTLYH